MATADRLARLGFSSSRQRYHHSIRGSTLIPVHDTVYSVTCNEKESSVPELELESLIESARIGFPAARLLFLSSARRKNTSRVESGHRGGKTVLVTSGQMSDEVRVI